MSPIIIDDAGTMVGGPVETAAAIATNDDDAAVAEEATAAAACIELGVLPGPQTFVLDSCFPTISESVFWWARFT